MKLALGIGVNIYFSFNIFHLYYVFDMNTCE